MADQNLQNVYRQTRLNESDEYLRQREELRLAEIESMKLRERVAELRRQLPQGAIVQDYEFIEGPADLNAGDTPTRKIRLSELFSAPNRSLVIYHFMYGKKQTTPCPMCTMWIDGYNGVAHHLDQNLDFVILAAAEPQALREHARRRGWTNLRLISAGESMFKYDLGSEEPDGVQDSTISVFTRDAGGNIRHFYSTHPRLGADIEERGIDLLTPVYNLLDLTPEGRGDWYGSLDYGSKVSIARHHN